VATDYSSFQPTKFLHPRFWPTWLGLGLLRLTVMLPYRPAIAVGRLLGRVSLLLLPTRKRIARTNIDLCFPELDETRRDEIVRRCFDNIGIAVIEMGMGWWWPRERLQSMAEFEGLEHLDRAIAQGRGAVLITGHFTSLEIGGWILNYARPLQAMFRKQRNPLFDAYLNWKRSRSLVAALPRDNLRAMIRGIRSGGHPTWYAPDQDFKSERTVFAPFFGVPASTLTASARIAQATGAPFLPYAPYRKPDGKGYLIRIDPPIEGFPIGDELADATRLNAELERQIRFSPDQYMWMHQRFKSRPPGEPPVY
jgi:KDO2-lipid IV(A) lauroyltransferase